MKALPLAFALVFVIATAAAADVLPNVYCSVTGDLNGTVLIAPGPLAGTTLTVSVRNAQNVPIPNAIVQIWFDQQIRLCAGGPPYAVTDAQGICQLQLRGGGCVTSTLPVCGVTANGVEIRVYMRVRSPDNGAHDHSAPDGTVGTVDLPFFAEEFKGVVPAGCHDYDGSGGCDTGDLPFFGDAFKTAMHCTLQ